MKDLDGAGHLQLFSERRTKTRRAADLRNVRPMIKPKTFGTPDLPHEQRSLSSTGAHRQQTYKRKKKKRSLNSSDDADSPPLTYKESVLLKC